MLHNTITRLHDTTKSIDFKVKLNSDVVYTTFKLSKYFIVNLYLIWIEIIVSGPKIIVAVGTGVHVTIKVRIIIAICIVCNVNIVSITKGWTIIIIAVCGAFLTVADVVFKVSIPIIVSQ